MSQLRKAGRSDREFLRRFTQLEQDVAQLRRGVLAPDSLGEGGIGALPGCRLTRASSVTLTASGVSYAVAPTSADFDSGPCLSGGSVSAPCDGRFTISAEVEFAANGTGSRFVSLTAGLVELAVARLPTAGASEPTRVQVATTVELTAGDILTVLAAQTSGGSLNATALVLCLQWESARV